jgi:hypothetical protein
MATEKIEAEKAPSPITSPKQDDEGNPIIPAAEITLPEEEGGEATITEESGEQAAPETPAAQPEKRGKNRVPAKQRINQLYHEARQFQSEAQRLAAENESLKAQMATKDTERQTVNAAAMDTHEARWKSERELARREMIDAKNAADPAKEADAIGRLSRAESELGNIEAWKASQPKKLNGAAPVEQPKPAAQPQGNGQGQPVTVSPEIQAWVEQNLWAVNDERNAQFDPEMANYMANQANILEMRMRRQGRVNEIGTKTYFDEIDRMMREEFPDRFDDSEEEDVPEQPRPRAQPQPAARPANQRQAPQMQRQPAAPVAPASASAGQQAPRGQAKTVQLTAEARQFAHQMAANGALRYPPGHKLAGKNMQPADAEVAYARQVLAQQKS